MLQVALPVLQVQVKSLLASVTEKNVPALTFLSWETL